MIWAMEDVEDKKRQACLEKLTWESKEMAEAARAYAGWQYGESKTLAYPCKHCGKWRLARAV